MTTTTSTSSILPSEAAHFAALAADWWNPGGSSAMLHRLNPARLRFIRQAIDAHWRSSPGERRPLVDKRALDVGCGAGLLTEPLARLGADTVGVDAAAENVAAASLHAAGQHLPVTYHHGDIADPEFAGALGAFDLVTAMEVIEHVADPALFLSALAGRLADGGLLILSTPNRTAASWLLLVEAAERFGAIPRGTHDWHRFLRPEEMTDLANAAGLSVREISGIGPDLASGMFRTGGSRALNYIMVLTRA